MKIAAAKDFGDTKNNKIVLPLVPEPTETATEKEDLATVNLHSDPTDADSTKDIEWHRRISPRSH